MKRRLLLVLLMSLLTTSTLTGCSGSLFPTQTIDIDNDSFESGKIVDKYISVEQKGKFVLHKGEVFFLDDNGWSHGVAIDINKMKFDCGKELNTNATYYLSDKEISEDLYDEVCEDCFNQ